MVSFSILEVCSSLSQLQLFSSAPCVQNYVQASCGMTASDVVCSGQWRKGAGRFGQD